jgi:hypothetical protein
MSVGRRLREGLAVRPAVAVENAGGHQVCNKAVMPGPCPKHGSALAEFNVGFRGLLSPARQMDHPPAETAGSCDDAGFRGAVSRFAEEQENAGDILSAGRVRHGRQGARDR